MAPLVKALKKTIYSEILFIKNILSSSSIPTHNKDDDNEYIYESTNGTHEAPSVIPKRAQSITELEERLQKLKSEKNYNVKSKLMKKSLNSKLSKKIKKQERLSKPRVKTHPKPQVDAPEKPSPTIAKPVFNTDGKLVFSKFDFANTGKKAKLHKAEKDPKKILKNLEEQEQKIKALEHADDGDDKAKELREKISWKSVLQKAEGQKVKDDKTLLKKSIKKLDQKKKQSKKQWDTRIQGVEQKKADRQKKRKENIQNKKKEKKSKIVKAAVKRGRVVI